MSEQVSERPTDVTTGRDRGGTGRSIAAVVCFVLAALLTIPGALAFWGQRTLTDTQRYIDTVGPLIDDPAVQDAVSTVVVDVIDQQLDTEQIVNNVFGDVITDRPRLQALVGPLDGAIMGFVDSQVRSFVASDVFRSLWLEMNTRAQQSLIRVLEGDQGGAVQLQGDQIVLDVGVVVDQVKQRLVDRGLTIVENAPIPDVDKQIVLLNAPQLQQARTIYAFASPVATWLIAVVALLYLGAFLLARRRPRMTVAIGIALVANALLMAFAVSTGRQLFVNELSGTVFGPASGVFYDTLLSYLIRGWQVYAWLGVFLAVAGWFAGSTASGSATRTWVRSALEIPGRSLAGSGVSGAGRWVAGNAAWLRWVAFGLGVVVLMWGMDVSVAREWWALLLVLVLLAVIQVFVGVAEGGQTSTDTDAETVVVEVQDTVVVEESPRS